MSQDPFRELSPPPGGLRALRVSIDVWERRRVMLRGSLLAVAVVVVALWVWWPHSVTSRVVIVPDHPDVELTKAPTSEPVRVRASSRDELAIQRVEVADPSVLFYRVQRVAVDRARPGQSEAGEGASSGHSQP